MKQCTNAKKMDLFKPAVLLYAGKSKQTWRTDLLNVCSLCFLCQLLASLFTKTTAVA